MGLTSLNGAPRARRSGEHGGTLLSSGLPSMDQYCEAVNRSGNDTTGMSPGARMTGQVLLRSITVVVALCGLVGNGAVIWLIRASVRKNPFSAYNLSLAAADLMHLCSQIVFCARQILKPFLHRCFHLPGILMVLRFSSYFTGLGVMTAISLQRCLSVLFPIWYRCHCPRHLSAGVSALLWLLTFLMNILRGHACGQLSSPTTRFCPALVAITDAWVAVLFVTMGTSSLLLLRQVRDSARLHLPRRLYLVVLLTALVFFLCGVPLSVIRFLIWKVESQALNDVSVLLSCVNSTANPAVYFFIGGLRGRPPKAPLAGVSGGPQGKRQSPGEAPAPPNGEGAP
ncbi:mas-related G-protein coupled receptor member X2-like isoform X1 [Lynx canadensis]|uniref:mas-related G-protein coupled receptor member X2-like isoform X1 n=2 Tax=Lynx canadensis TaxID=61383 RepID=UPI0011B02A34|nr:mas-related G-protein coupled receptor member X2-like isoform X1 [Lynx canadensis]